MRKIVTKKLRKIIMPSESPFSKRVYRRAKRDYSKLPHHAKSDFIELLRATYNAESVAKAQYREPLA